MLQQLLLLQSLLLQMLLLLQVLLLRVLLLQVLLLQLLLQALLLRLFILVQLLRSSPPLWCVGLRRTAQQIDGDGQQADIRCLWPRAIGPPRLLRQPPQWALRRGGLGRRTAAARRRRRAAAGPGLCGGRAQAARILRATQGQLFGLLCACRLSLATLR